MISPNRVCVRFLPGLLLFLVLGSLQAQETDLPGEPESLSDLFTRGHLEGHIRGHFINTMNQGELRDYYAMATGGLLKYRTAEYHGFQAGVAGIFTYKVFSTDLNEPDPTTGKVSKWEHELFDILDFNNFHHLDRLEELYLQYHFQTGSITYGKLEIEDTPLLNRSDGRMKPFAFKGTWLRLQPGKKAELHLAWLDRISPRSTVEWFGFNEGIGLTNNGFQPNGIPAVYHENQESKGVALLGYLKATEAWHLEAYQWYIHHLNHTSWLELGYGQGPWELGLQYSLQFSDGFQEELPYDQRFVQPGENGQVLSSQVSWAASDWVFRTAFTHAFDSGRYLFPRELGRDHFFTSIPRSRLEGFGDSDILTVKGEYREKQEGFSGCLSLTRLWGPQTGAYTSNKYNLDAYWQVNTGLHYRFSGFLRGMKMDLLYIYRENINDTDPETIFNRSNFHQVNLVLNYVVG